jgi:hypothetical protein
MLRILTDVTRSGPKVALKMAIALTLVTMNDYSTVTGTDFETLKEAMVQDPIMDPCDIEDLDPSFTLDRSSWGTFIHFENEHEHITCVIALCYRKDGNMERTLRDLRTMVIHEVACNTRRAELLLRLPCVQSACEYGDMMLDVALFHHLVPNEEGSFDTRVYFFSLNLDHKFEGPLFNLTFFASMVDYLTGIESLGDDTPVSHGKTFYNEDGTICVVRFRTDGNIHQLVEDTERAAEHEAFIAYGLMEEK